MQDLNKLEKEILHVIARDYPVIKSHIPYLQVKSREYTGAGMYVNFGYQGFADEEVMLLEDGLLSVNKVITLDGLENGPGFTYFNHHTIQLL